MDLLKRLEEIRRNEGLNKNTNLKITCVDGQVLIGKYFGYTQALDNEPEIADIEICQIDKPYITAIFENEIKEIEVI